MTQSEFYSKIPGIIIDPSHGELFLYIRYDKEDDDIVMGYKDENNNNNSFGAFGKTYQVVFDDIYPVLVKHGHISLK
jgi:hypothetical protein